MIIIEVKKIEEGLVPIYENETKERLINARELHKALKVGRDFTTWIKDRINKYKFIQNEDFIITLTKIGERKNVIKHEYYLSIDGKGDWKRGQTLFSSDLGSVPKKDKKIFKTYLQILNINV